MASTTTTPSYADVVDIDRYPLHQLDIVHQHALGQLQFQPLRIGAG